VIDAQDELSEPLARLHATLARCYAVNPAVKFEVFIHKVDALTDDQKLGVQRAIQQQVLDELVASKLGDGIHVNFYLTSIYDHTVFEAFSKVLQKLVAQLPTLESLLDVLLSNCRMEKVFLVDVLSKLYLATDSSPVDMATYELCSDMIDVILDVAAIYGTPAAAQSSSSSSNRLQQPPQQQQSSQSSSSGGSAAIIKLSSGMVLYLREVNKFLALVALIRGDKFEKQGLIDYNFDTLKRALTQLFEVARVHNLQQQQQQQSQTEGARQGQSVKR
jgi:Ras-related GTP-binding protein C/D